MIRNIIGCVWFAFALAVFVDLNALRDWQFWPIYLPTVAILTWKNDEKG